MFVFYLLTKIKMTRCENRKKLFRLERSFVGNDFYWRAWTCCHSEVTLTHPLSSLSSSSWCIFIIILIASSLAWWFVRLAATWPKLSSFPLVQKSYHCLQNFNHCQLTEPGNKEWSFPNIHLFEDPKVILHTNLSNNIGSWTICQCTWYLPCLAHPGLWGATCIFHAVEKHKLEYGATTGLGPWVWLTSFTTAAQLVSASACSTLIFLSLLMLVTLRLLYMFTGLNWVARECTATRCVKEFCGFARAAVSFRQFNPDLLVFTDISIHVG